MRFSRRKVETWLQYPLLVLLGLVLVVLVTREGQSPEPISTSYLPASRSHPSTEVKLNRVTNDTDLIDIRAIDQTIVLDIRYATKNNFTHQRLYAQARCLLRPETAKRLAQVQMGLEQQGLGLKVYDCYRPLSVQKRMWQVVPNNLYVANPSQGSRHNRGSAVDVTLVDHTGKELPMPTPFDDFSERAHTNYTHLSSEVQRNRQRLKQAMASQGFVALKSEWWHFDAQDWEKYPVLDIPLDAIP